MGVAIAMLRVNGSSFVKRLGIAVVLVLAALALAALLVGCAAAPRPIAAEPEADALSKAALDTLEREGCAQLLERTFPLVDPRTNASTGRLWVRKCSAQRTATALSLDVEVLGWQWTGEESWGFEVREYVYFSAVISATLSAQIEAAGNGVSLRVWTQKPPDVLVRAIGRVDAKASTPASTLLGAASALAGKGPNALATAALRSRVRELIAARAATGIPIAIGEAPPVRTAVVPARPALLDEVESLHPGGALISGSFAPGLTTTLRWAVDGPPGEGVALARPVCVDEAVELVDAVVGGHKPKATAAPRDVVTLSGSGEASMPALPCRWVLVTGTRDDRALTARLVLGERPARVVAHPTRQWVKATLAAYDLTAAAPPKKQNPSDQEERDALAVTFAIGPASALRSFGRALATARSSSVEQVAPLFEVQRDAPVTVHASEQRPKPPSLFNATPGYDETLLGEGTLSVPATGERREQTVTLLRDGQPVGWARFDLQLLDVE